MFAMGADMRSKNCTGGTNRISICSPFCSLQVSGLCSLMDHAYTKHQLLRMERKVLCALKFDLVHCPALHFLLIFASVARCSAMVAARRARARCSAVVLTCYPPWRLCPAGGVDGSLPAGAVSSWRPVCGLPARTAGRSRSVFGPTSPAGAPDPRGRGRLVPGLQHPCGQVGSSSPLSILFIFSDHSGLVCFQ